MGRRPSVWPPTVARLHGCGRGCRRPLPVGGLRGDAGVIPLPRGQAGQLLGGQVLAGIQAALPLLGCEADVDRPAVLAGLARLALAVNALAALVRHAVGGAVAGLAVDGGSVGTDGDRPEGDQGGAALDAGALLGEARDGAGDGLLKGRDADGGGVHRGYLPWSVATAPDQF